MVLNTVFVPHDLSIELVDQFVHRSVQIFMRAFGKQVISLDMDAAFRTLPSLFLFLIFNCKEHFDIHDLVKMSHDPI